VCVLCFNTLVCCVLRQIFLFVCAAHCALVLITYFYPLFPFLITYLEHFVCLYTSRWLNVCVCVYCLPFSFYTTCHVKRKRVRHLPMCITPFGSYPFSYAVLKRVGNTPFALRHEPRVSIRHLPRLPPLCTRRFAASAHGVWCRGERNYYYSTPAYPQLRG